MTFHLESIPHSWKNEIDTLYIENPKDGSSKAINDGCVVHTESENQHKYAFGAASVE